MVFCLVAGCSSCGLRPGRFHILFIQGRRQAKIVKFAAAGVQAPKVHRQPPCQHHGNLLFAGHPPAALGRKFLPQLRPAPPIRLQAHQPPDGLHQRRAQARIAMLVIVAGPASRSTPPQAAAPFAAGIFACRCSLGSTDLFVAFLMLFWVAMRVVAFGFGFHVPL